MTTEFLGPGSGSQGPDLKRLLLAVVLMTGVLMAYNTFFEPNLQENQTEVVAVETTEKNESPAVANAKAAALAVTREPGINPTKSNIPLVKTKFVSDTEALDEKAQSEDEAAQVATRAGYKFFVTNQGAQISDYELVGYKAPIPLGINHRGVDLFAIASRNENLTLPVDARYVVKSSAKNEIVLEHLTPQGIKVQRRFKLSSNQFMVEHDIVLRNIGKKTRTVALDMFMNTPEPEEQSSGFMSQGGDQTSIVWKGSEKREVVDVAGLEENKVFEGTASYTGFDSRYFLVALVPSEPAAVEKTSISLWEADVDSVKTKGALLTLHEKPIELLSGETRKISFSSYMGPKQLALLEAAGHQLDENINFGWFSVISRPLLWLLGQIFALVGNFGFAIILLTLLIKLLTFPLTQKSFVSMQQMKKIAPDIKALQKKYSHDRSLLGQKQMELYKEKGINPMAGCLPMIIQMPIWFALYQMLWNSVELYQQPFMLWITDLTAPDPFYILPVAMGATMFIQQAFQPTMEDQPHMKYVMWGMPLFLTFIMLKMPAGLSLYIFINNVLTIFQQLLIKHRYGDKSPAAVASTASVNQITKGTRSHGFKK